MAKLSTITLIDKNSNFDAGAAFSICQPNSCNKIIQLDSGWEVEVASGCPYVVVRAKEIAQEELIWTAYAAAQEGLDLLSANREADLSVQNSEKDRITWWKNGQNRFLRITSLRDWPFRFEIKKGEMKDASGNIILPQKIQYHPALRYARLARITSDIFDAYRNMYLALEFLTSSISPRVSGKNQESELNWLKRVLTQTNLDYPNFQPFSESDVQEVYNVRCNIFHAKNEKNKLIPYVRKDYLKVKEIFEKLEWFVLILSGVILHTNRGKSYWGLEFFKKKSEELLSKNEIFICNENNQFFENCLEGNILINDLNLPSKLAVQCLDLCEPRLTSCLATFSSSELKMDEITGFFIQAPIEDGRSILAGAYKIETTLTTEDLDFLEVHIGMILNQ